MYKLMPHLFTFGVCSQLYESCMGRSALILLSFFIAKQQAPNRLLITQPAQTLTS
jgi:hypothetical protein